MIKAIETEYRGFRFRSRLEARWAVFFDAAGIAWEYEPEGYDCDGVLYLPDFRIIVNDEFWLYVEVKGKMQDTDLEKINNFVRSGGGPVLTVGNIPITIEEIDTAYKNDRVFELIEEDVLFRGPEFFFAWSPETKEALKIARGARFEHSEKPDCKPGKRCKGFQEIKHLLEIPYIVSSEPNAEKGALLLLRFFEKGYFETPGELEELLCCFTDEESAERIMRRFWS